MKLFKFKNCKNSSTLTPKSNNNKIRVSWIVKRMSKFAKCKTDVASHFQVEMKSKEK